MRCFLPALLTLTLTGAGCSSLSDLARVRSDVARLEQTNATLAATQDTLGRIEQAVLVLESTDASVGRLDAALHVTGAELVAVRQEVGQLGPIHLALSHALDRLEGLEETNRRLAGVSEQLEQLDTLSAGVGRIERLLTLLAACVVVGCVGALALVAARWLRGHSARAARPFAVAPPPGSPTSTRPRARAPADWRRSARSRRTAAGAGAEQGVARDPSASSPRRNDDGRRS